MAGLEIIIHKIVTFINIYEHKGICVIEPFSGVSLI